MAKQPQLFTRDSKGRYHPYVAPDPRPDKNVYRHLPNGKYEPFGVFGYPDWFNDGLWLVRHNASNFMNADRYASTWGLTKIADLPVTDLTKIATAAELYDIIDKYLFDTFGYTVNGLPHQDLTNELVNLIININNSNT